MIEAVPSAASDAVIDAAHPSPANGGPCATCAFRKGTEANLTAHTMALARSCVEGLRPFYCHEQPQLCRGFSAAVNLRGTPDTDEDRAWCEIAAIVADIIGECIAEAKAADAVARTGGASTDGPRALKVLSEGSLKVSAPDAQEQDE